MSASLGDPSFGEVMLKKRFGVNDVDTASENAETMLGFVLYTHGVSTYLKRSKTNGEEEVEEHVR